MPYPVVLVLAGIGFGFAFDWAELAVEPHLMLAIVLPAVLYTAAINTSWRDFRLACRPILLLAIGLVATTTLAVELYSNGWYRRLGGRCVSYGRHRFATGRGRCNSSSETLRLPRRIVTLLEGESLVNDATGLGLFRISDATVLTGAFRRRWSALG